jgi:hypothetical protein
MHHTLTLQLPDKVYAALTDQAKRQGRSLEDLIAAGLAKAAESSQDPLLRWSGFIQCGPADVAERHDHYLGQAILEELRGNG